MTISVARPWPALLNILIEPRATLAGLVHQKRSFWIPIVVSLVSAELFWIWYYNSVDFAWLKDFLLDISNPNATAEQRAALAKFITWKVQLWSTLAGVLIVMLAGTLLQAGYLLIVAKVQDDDDTSFLDWFNLSAWASVPRILPTFMAAVMFASSANRQIAPTDLNPVSLNALVLHLSPTHHWAGLANTLDVTLLWSIALIGIGFAIRKQTSLVRGMLVSVVPHVLIYGGWAVLKLTSGS